MKFVSLLLLPILCIASAHAQSPCPPGDAARAAMLPLGIQNKLLAHKSAPDDFELDAPADVSREVVMLRKTLDVATQAFFHCEAGDNSVPAILQTRLTAFLHAKESNRDESYERHYAVYGANLTVHVETAKGIPNSLFVVLTFDIECGEDNLLFLYTKEHGQWDQRLHWYSDRYTAPSDAFGDFFLYTVTPGPNNLPLIAVAHGTPWCTSRFSGFNVDLVQPASPDSQQKLIASSKNGYSRGDTLPTLRPYPEGVTLRLDSSSKDLEGVFTYVGVFRYRTVSGKLERLPVAGNVRDFVDSWLDESWAVASRWSENPNSVLQAAHARFKYGGDDEKDVPTIQYGPVRACSSRRDLFQVEIDLKHYVKTNGPSKQEDLPPIYAQIRQNPNSFTMLSITDGPDPTCTGPDLMKKHPTQATRQPTAESPLPP